MDFSNKLSRYVARVESGLDQYLPSASVRPARLHEAMRYSVEAGGKRLRPTLVLAACELCTHPPASGAAAAPDALPLAVAIECLHTYSLVHDDLPCMDDDDLRRGRPTAHKAFDEATALLAGDALLTHAFGLVAQSYAADPSLVSTLVGLIADAAGSRRLIGGQMEDLLGERDSHVTPDELEFIHLNKTAAMIELSLEAGSCVAGAGDAARAALRQAGRHLGLAFQIIDDVLDVTSDPATLGKTPGKDAATEKATFVRLFGLDASRARAATETRAAVEGFAAFAPSEARDFLVELTQSLLGRIR